MDKIMNIYAQHGDKVIFDHPNNGRKYDEEKCELFLTVGDTYTVSYTEVYNCFTHVYLKEVPGVCFNSVMFSDYKK